MQDPYDAVAYPGLPYSDTHPDNLAAKAILHGLTPPPVEYCRVLEIGCSEGANLIPMAYAIPESEFVGIDLAHLPIERGKDRIRELGLTNVRLFAGNLLDVGAELGMFDYIIAHGVYAWVPEPVRDGLLALCGRLLSENGVAFVSYNALPGGHLRNMIREIMLYEVKDVSDPALRVSGATEFLRFVLEARPQDDPYRALIEAQLKRMEKHEPEVIYHDELGETYHPVYFANFIEHARKHGLQYLCESVLPPPTDPSYRAETLATLARIAGDDILKQEQALDFLRARMFRETLLYRAGAVLRRDFPAEHFRRLYFSSQVTSECGKGPGTKVFVLPGGIRMESNHPGAIALMEALEKAWPRSLCLAEIERRVEGSGFVLDSDGATLLLRLAVAKMIQLHSWRAPVAEKISTRPRASASSRQEARTASHATSLLHSSLSLEDPIVRSFLEMLDGTRDRNELLDAMKARFPAMAPEELAVGIEPGLATLHHAGFLEA